MYNLYWVHTVIEKTRVSCVVGYTNGCTPRFVLTVTLCIIRSTTISRFVWSLSLPPIKIYPTNLLQSNSSIMNLLPNLLHSLTRFINRLPSLKVRRSFRSRLRNSVLHGPDKVLGFTRGDWSPVTTHWEWLNQPGTSSVKILLVESPLCFHDTIIVRKRKVYEFRIQRVAVKEIFPFIPPFFWYTDFYGYVIMVNRTGYPFFPLCRPPVGSSTQIYDTSKKFSYHVINVTTD